MNQIVEIRNIKIGEGIPKVCVSLIGKDDQELLNEVKHLKSLPIDVVEWRMDYHENVEDINKMEIAAKLLREGLGDKPILATFRSKKEGGEKEISLPYYVALNKAIIRTGLADLVDIELFIGDESVKDMVDFAHTHEVKVIMSNHDFYRTPEQEEIVRRLCKMQEMGADIPKIAVMPQSTEDVLVLLSATNEMATKYADRPIITMSMSKLGVISRLAGETFGSALTFGSAKIASAPGQIPVEELVNCLKIIHGR